MYIFLSIFGYEMWRRENAKCVRVCEYVCVLACSILCKWKWLFAIYIHILWISVNAAPTFKTFRHSFIPILHRYNLKSFCCDSLIRAHNGCNEWYMPTISAPHGRIEERKRTREKKNGKPFYEKTNVCGGNAKLYISFHHLVFPCDEIRSFEWKRKF